MQERHLDRKKYFQEQEITTSKYVIPFIHSVLPVHAGISVLEIGCGEAGNLKPFLDMGCQKLVGIDLSESKIELARQFYSPHPQKSHLRLIAADIYDVFEELGPFDLIITRDVIEHIHGQEKFMRFSKNLLKPGGKFFLGFPPWYNPFGGHQQICESKFLSKLPYFHLLPKPLYRLLLKSFGESQKKIESLEEIKQTGISIERFEKILRDTGYHIDKKQLYAINPNYEVKFNLKPRKQNSLLARIPFIRNFFTTVGYYVVSPKAQ
jgi:SAM-dependent methyltransferase